VSRKQVPDQRAIGGRDWRHVGRLRIARRRANPVRCPEKHRAAREAGPEVPARPADHDDRSARHVLAGVIAHTLHHRDGSTVSLREPLSSAAGDEHAPPRRVAQHAVAGEHVPSTPALSGR
jgi:hypothetical protein